MKTDTQSEAQRLLEFAREVLATLDRTIAIVQRVERHGPGPSPTMGGGRTARAAVIEMRMRQSA